MLLLGNYANKFLRNFFGKQDTFSGNIFTNERTTTLPNFFKGAALAATGMRFTSNRSYSEKQINNMVENYISKLINNKVKRFPIEHVEEFIEVQGRIVEKLKKSFWTGNDVTYIRQYQRAYAYYNALVQVLEYEKSIGE